MTPNEMMNPNARWIGVAAAARLLGLTEPQVRGRIASGALPSEKILGRIALLEQAVLAYRDRGAR